MLSYQDDFNPVSLVQHPTPGDIVQQFFSAEEEDTLEEAQVGGFTMEGAEVGPISPEEMVAGIRAMGLWGFADTKKGEIHYWKSSAPFPRLVHFFAHELVHLNPEPEVDVRGLPPEIAEDVIEENRCEYVGRLAALAVELAQQA